MFKTFEVEEFYDMIAYAIREGLIFEANVCDAAFARSVKAPPKTETVIDPTGDVFIV